MTRSEFLSTLRRRLGGLPATEIEDTVADYSMHFDEGMAEGRSETEIAKALGDPLRVARELRAEIGFKRWEEARTPATFIGAMFGFLALVAVDFILLLPVLLGLLLFTLIAAMIAIALCLGGLFMALDMSDGIFSKETLSNVLLGVGLLGFGVGGGALLVWLMDAVVRLLAKYARLHYTLLNRADLTA